MMEALEERVMLWAALPQLGGPIARDAGGGRIAVAAGDVLERTAVVLRLGADGTPDPTFGRGGVVRIPGVRYVTAFETRPDGTSLVLCERRDGETAVVRLARDGEVDASFGVGGWAAMPAHAPSAEGMKSNMTVMADGRFVVAETPLDWHESRLFAARFLPDGGPDVTFGDRGAIAFGPFDMLSGVTAVNARPDGSIDLAIDRFEASGAAFMRLGPDGAVDTSFGHDGIAVREIGGVNTNWYSYRAMPDGRTLSYGESGELRAYDRDGNPLPGFGGAGGAVLFDGVETEIAPQGAPAVRAGDHTIVALYAPGLFEDGPDYFVLLATDDAGALDASWGDAGRHDLAVEAGYGIFIALAASADGGLIETHLSFPTESTPASEPGGLVVNRLDPAGHPDPRFGEHGRVYLPMSRSVNRQGGDANTGDVPPPAAPGDGEGDEGDDGDPFAGDSLPPPAGATITPTFSSRLIDDGVDLLLHGTPAERRLLGEAADDLFDP
jgi:uncharacterized delta-60 repeat protein